MVQLAARAHRTSEQRTENTPIYFKQATIFCLYSLIPLTLRATRAPWPSRAGPPSSLWAELKSDTWTFEYERHRACLSVKTSNDEPSHVPLHARTLRGVALSSWWSSLWSRSAQAARRGFRGIMEALNWYWRCTACIFFVFKCVTVYLKWWKTGMRGYFMFTTALRSTQENQLLGVSVILFLVRSSCLSFFLSVSFVLFPAFSSWCIFFFGLNCTVSST